MEINLEVWCAKCMSRSDISENVYCERCLDSKDEELQGLEDEINDLNKIISGLEEEINKLK